MKTNFMVGVSMPQGTAFLRGQEESCQWSTLTAFAFDSVKALLETPMELNKQHRLNKKPTLLNKHGLLPVQRSSLFHSDQ